MQEKKIKIIQMAYKVKVLISRGVTNPNSIAPVHVKSTWLMDGD